jgi:hypothetical protein
MTRSQRAAELARLAIPSDAHPCRACKLRPPSWTHKTPSLCPECWLESFLRGFESHVLSDTIREFRDAGRGG